MADDSFEYVRKVVMTPCQFHGCTALRAHLLLCAVLTCAPSSELRAEPESDVRQAVSALAATSYAWETTVQQRFTGETATPRMDLNAAIEVKGRTDPSTYTEITLMPSRELNVPVTAVFQMGDAVGHTPEGWRRRTDIRQNAGPDRTVEFNGKQVRASRVFSTALRVMSQRTPADELLELMPDLKSFQNNSGLIVAEMRDRAVERLWADPRATRAPEIQGTVIFKFSDAGLSEYHVVLAIGFPSSKAKKVAWSMVQWSTRISGHGATAVEPPAEAVKALAE